MREETTNDEPMRPAGIDDDQRDEPAPDVMPAGAPRGAPTIPSPTHTGTTTPPISGWGEALEPGEDQTEDEPADPRPR